MSLSKLDKLFQPFVDSLGEFYELQKTKLSTSHGIKVDIYPFLHWHSFEGCLGGINSHGFMVINQRHSGSSIFFSSKLEQLFPCFYSVPPHVFQSEYLNYSRDFSIRLQLRTHFKEVCLFPDEQYEYSLSCGDYLLPGKWSKVGETYEFITEYSSPELVTLIKNHGLQLSLILVKSGLLRSQFEKLVFFETTLNECIYTFLELIKNPHYYEHNFDHFNKTLTKFKLTKNSVDVDEFFSQINRLNASSFLHLDFYQWNELFLSFSVIKDFKGYYLENKKNTEFNLQQLKKNLPILPGKKKF